MLDTDTRAILVCVGANVARLRKKGALTQEEFAESISCEPNYLQKIEYGNATPSLPLLVRIAKQLGVKVGVLFREAKRVRAKGGRPKKKLATPSQRVAKKAVR